MPSLTDIRFADIAQKVRKDKIMAEKPSMPELTPGDGIGAATVALILGGATQADTDLVKVTALICAAVVASIVAFVHGRVRAARNQTERARIVTANQPTVMIDSDDGFEEFEEIEE